jgi:hypothetical protein
MTQPNPNFEQELIEILKELDKEVKQAVTIKIDQISTSLTSDIHELTKTINIMEQNLQSIRQEQTLINTQLLKKIEEQDKVIKSLQQELHSNVPPKTYEDYKTRININFSSLDITIPFYDICSVIEDGNKQPDATELISLVFLIYLSSTTKKITDITESFLDTKYNNFLKTVDCEYIMHPSHKPLTPLSKQCHTTANKYQGKTKLGKNKLGDIHKQLSKL